MKATSSAAWPVRSLRERIETLKKTIDDCVESPEVKHVHKLRTTARRIEGQLVLLKEIPDAPRLRQTKKLRRDLKQLRREAGAVRDLDVLLEHVARLRPNTPSKRDRERLRDTLQTERAHEARALQHLLERRGSKLLRRIAELLDQLEQHNALTIEPAALAQLAHAWFLQRTQRAAHNKDDTTRLHDIRKAAKLARYMGENAGGRSNAAIRLAEQMEELQEAGGRWHDCLTLAEAAAMRLAKSSSLPSHLSKRCVTLRDGYERMLQKVIA
jgi:CHAD domain-containing protein